MQHGRGWLQLLLGLIVSVTLTACATFGSGPKYFKSRKDHISFSYPRHWTTGIPRRPHTRAVVYSPANRTNCRVNIKKLSPPFQGASKDFFSKMTAAEIARLFTRRMPYSKVLDSRRTTIGGQEAVFFLIDMRPSFADIWIRMSVYTTYYNGVLYYVGCGTKKHLYQQELPNFNLFYSSFRFY